MSSRNLGARLPRVDGVGKVTGAALYASDVTLPGMLTGKVFRSTQAHARIRRLDVEAAKALPGVAAVVTAQDVPQTRYGPAVRDTPLLASERVLFIGQPVALIAAMSDEAAEAAMKAIVVEYEPLPAIFDVRQSMQDDATELHPEWKTYKTAPYIARGGNVASRASLEHGDVDTAFRNAKYIHEHSFDTQVVHAGYTEARVAVARWEGSDLTVWSNCQLPFEVQATLSDILDVPLSSIRVIVPGIGGGFGGKLRIGVDHYAAVLAQKARRPVRVLSSTEEELTAAHPRQPALVTIKTGVDENGLIVAKTAQVIVDTGAFAGSGPGVASIALQIVAGPYRTPNYRLESFAVYTNKTPTGSFRAPSGPMGNFALECHMDLVAKDLGLDPVEFRLRNLVEEGDVGPAGETLRSVSIRECLLRAADAIGWDMQNPGLNRGKGIACGWWMTTGGAAGVTVKIAADGGVVLASGSVELGTGALTGAAQILAEELAVTLDDIRITPVDTNSSPYDYGAQGSRTMFSVGNACIAAAADLKQQIFTLAADHFDVSQSELELRDNHVFAGNRQVSLAELARKAQLSGKGGLIASGTTNALPNSYDQTRVKNHPLPAWNTPTFHAHSADVSVDVETGDVKINKYVVVQDVGFAVNPTYIEGQIEGGVAQGLGQALFEEVVYRDGRVVNANLTDYKMPTAVDVPKITSILVECPSHQGPHGAKGVGEPPCIEPPATIANAIHAATGLMPCSLPMTPEKILRGLKALAATGCETNARLAPQLASEGDTP
jgi:CO/xanthine dehydrogenase Mo-binding subunit